MNFPAFWARGEHRGFLSWRWSDQSLSEAQALATEAARKLAEQFAQGTFDRDSRYGYGDRPMREPVLREFTNGAGERVAVISRNSYGCLVLNTVRVMFLDVDLPESGSSSGGLFKKLFGKPAAPPADPAAATLAKAEAWARNNPGWGWRIYRTRAGLRLLATHAVFDAVEAAANGIFEALGADPLYRQLCKTQKCFRARLTPKPWRCGVWRRAQRWPWADAKAEARFKAWEQKYLSACNGFATCELIASFGNVQVHPEVQLILGVHDESTRVGSKLKLA